MKIPGIIRTVWLHLKPHKVYNGDFKRRRRYRVSVQNMSSLSTVAEVRSTRGWLIAASIVALLFGGALVASLVVYTPLRNLLPDRLQSDLRNDYEAFSLRLDSVSESAAITDRYLQNVINVLTDSMPDAQAAFAQPLPIDSLALPTEAEIEFVKRFEDAQRFNLSVLSPIAAVGMSFYTPFAGLPVEEKGGGIPRLEVIQPSRSPAAAIYRGTVIATNYITGQGATVVVQHPNDFISVYSGLDELYVNRGDNVDAGSRIGRGSGVAPMAIELWHNGSALPPSQYLVSQ